MPSRIFAGSCFEVVKTMARSHRSIPAAVIAVRAASAPASTETLFSLNPTPDRVAMLSPSSVADELRAVSYAKTSTMTTSPNADQIRRWTDVLAPAFIRFRSVLADGLGRHGAIALDANPPRSGEWILDVGCGFGESTLDLAA